LEQADMSLAFLALLGCNDGYSYPVPALAGQDIRLTILHTSDIHSRLIEYEFDPSYTDNLLGLADDAGPYGGIAEIAYILKRERARAGRSLHLDSGDCFQGAIIFNEFLGEAEMRTLTEAGLDAAVVGNHEFDAGAQNIASQAGAFAGFHLLAGNYDFENATAWWATELEEIVLPSILYSLDGLRVGVIGLANLSSLNSIYDEDNSLGVQVIHHGEVIRNEAAHLKAAGADVIIALSHMGLDDDLENAAEFEDVDVFIGGHHHVAIDPPLVVTNDSAGGKRIPVVHSGAFAKFVGRLDLVIRVGEELTFQEDGETRRVANPVVSHSYTLFPVDNAVPQDPAVLDIMDEYQDVLDQKYDTSQILGHAWKKLTRYGTSGGDSMLGNFTADAIRAWPGIETDFAMNNTLGIRSDIGTDDVDCEGPGDPEGCEWDITLNDLYNSFPFDNTITTMFLSGREVQELFDYATSRSTDRGCQSQVQVSGMSFKMNCADGVAEEIRINGTLIDPDGTYEMATNNYVAHGGSGFSMLERNTTQLDTGIEIRDVVRTAFTQYASLPDETNAVCVEDGRIETVF
jgi:5'-nucleotidase